ncbi:MAG: hypothetical protein ICV87_00345 [Gemmatimonadetes bacterium]|nr:hypothetical protein [Gemmatimonadota bacterium]
MSDEKLEGSVPLTDAIIQEIVEKGLAREEALQEAKAFGARYHPVRKSLIFPFDPGDDAGDDDVVDTE